ncbi:hypothetical protein M404DRAFT_998184 [Pisolithus tinctorius Marx 270]|uniref:Uncharacterized protein n=1 Tax=Pisolithus tinctorius Marx 270 TaxID=870435 RepID=A0A0C3JEF7_PISTI|nr:hypothetical protein M404DRAFT_998184 [Pisolithus tinctorius Marx 270]
MRANASCVRTHPYLFCYLPQIRPWRCLVYHRRGRDGIFHDTGFSFPILRSLEEKICFVPDMGCLCK